jgi:hypothetical protein
MYALPVRTARDRDDYGEADSPKENVTKSFQHNLRKAIRHFGKVVHQFREKQRSEWHRVPDRRSGGGRMLTGTQDEYDGGVDGEDVWA